MPCGWWLLVWLLWCASCQAQDLIIHLKNGDRITGRLLSESTNGVVIATAFSDKLPIAAGMIERREVVPVAAPAVPPIAPAVAAITNQPAITSTNRPVAPASGVVGELVLTNKPSMAQTVGGAARSPEAKPEPKPEAKPAPKAEPPKPPEPSAFMKFLAEWNGEAQLGANLGFSTKDRETFTSLIKVTHNLALAKDRHLRNILQYRYVLWKNRRCAVG